MLPTIHVIESRPAAYGRPYLQLRHDEYSAIQVSNIAYVVNVQLKDGYLHDSASMLQVGGSIDRCLDQSNINVATPRTASLPRIRQINT